MRSIVLLQDAEQVSLTHKGPVWAERSVSWLQIGHKFQKKTTGMFDTCFNNLSVNSTLSVLP